MLAPLKTDTEIQSNMFLLSLVSTGDKLQQGIRKITTKRDVICVIRRWHEKSCVSKLQEPKKSSLFVD